MERKATVMALVVVALGVSGCGYNAGPTASSTGGRPTQTVAAPVVLGEGRDRTGSRSASDWASSAEFVVAVTVVNEVRGKIANEDLEREEGMISREVVLRVDRLIWTAESGKVEAPQEIRQQAAGWVFNNNNGTGERPFALTNASRLEVGHSYVTALDWVDDPCSKDVMKGSWVGLGAFGTIPFDSGILGLGEVEGRIQDLRGVRVDIPTLRTDVAGKSVEELAAQLSTAERKKIAPHPTECEPED